MRKMSKLLLLLTIVQHRIHHLQVIHKLHHAKKMHLQVSQLKLHRNLTTPQPPNTLATVPARSPRQLKHHHILASLQHQISQVTLLIVHHHHLPIVLNSRPTLRLKLKILLLLLQRVHKIR